MYRIGDSRKFELYGKIFYTGTITSIDDNEIFINSIMGEELSFNRKEIKQSKLVKNRIGDLDGCEE
jgi:hypothetical protein